MISMIASIDLINILAKVTQLIHVSTLETVTLQSNLQGLKRSLNTFESKIINNCNRRGQVKKACMKISQLKKTKTRLCCIII